MALDWHRIEEAETTAASLWRLVDELHTSKPNSHDLVRVERLLKFGNLSEEVRKHLDEALVKFRIRSTQRLEPIWRATLNTQEHKALRDTMRDDEFVSAYEFKSPTSVASPESYPIDMELLDEDTAEVSTPELAAFDAQPDTEEILILREPIQEPTQPVLRDPALFTTSPIEVRRLTPEMSGMFARPDVELSALMPDGKFRLRYMNTIYPGVRRATLLHLFRRGVLLGADVFEEGEWISVNEHPSFEGLRRSVAAEIGRIVAKNASNDAVTKPNLSAAAIGPDLDLFDAVEEEHTHVLVLSGVDTTNVTQTPGPPDASDTRVFERELFEELELDDSSIFMTGELDAESLVTEKFSSISASLSGSWPFSGIFEEIDEIILSDVALPSAPLVPSHPRENTHAETPRSRGMVVGPEFPLPPSVRIRDKAQDAPEPKSEVEQASSDETAPLALVESPRPSRVELTAEIVRPQAKGLSEGPKILEDIARAEARAAAKAFSKKDTQPGISDPVPALVRRRRRRGGSPVLSAVVAAVIVLFIGGGAAFMINQSRLQTKEIRAQVPEVPSEIPAFGEAQRALHLATQVQVQDPDVQRRVARSLWGEGQRQAAISIAHVADQTQPTAESAHYLAEWHLKQSDYENARLMAFESFRRDGNATAARAIFAEAVRQDPTLRIESQRLDLTQLADSALDEGNGRVGVTLKKGEHVVARLEFAQRGDRSRPDRVVAASRLCSVIGCQFELPKAEPVRVERAQLREMLGAKNAKRLKRLRWKKDRVTKKRYVEAALISASSSDKVTPFPIEITKVWSPWLSPNVEAETLDRRVTTFLVPWDRFDADLRLEFAEASGDLPTRDLAGQISSMMLFDVLTGNTERFAKRKKSWGKSVEMRGQALRSLAHTSVFPTRRPKRMHKAYKNLKRFNSYEVFALSAMNPHVMGQILFPDSTRSDKRRSETFWARRNQVLVSIEADPKSLWVR